MEERIKNMYNDCARLFKNYTTNHDMAQFNKDIETVMVKYDCKSDIEGLVFWWSARVQGLHDQYMRSNNEKRR